MCHVPPPTVFLEARLVHVESSTVGFDTEPAVHHQVKVAQSGDIDLGLHVEPGPLEKVSCQAFDDGLGLRDDSGDNPPLSCIVAARKTLPQRRYRHAFQHDCGFRYDQPIEFGQAPKALNDGIQHRWRHCRTVADEPRIVSAVCECYMWLQWSLQDPKTLKLRLRDTRRLGWQRPDGDELIVGARDCVDAPGDPRNGALSQSSPQLKVGNAGGDEVFGANYAVVFGEHFGDLCHGDIVARPASMGTAPAFSMCTSAARCWRAPVMSMSHCPGTKNEHVPRPGHQE